MVFSINKNFNILPVKGYSRVVSAMTCAVCAVMLVFCAYFWHRKSIYSKDSEMAPFTPLCFKCVVDLKITYNSHFKSIIFLSMVDFKAKINF